MKLYQVGLVAIMILVSNFTFASEPPAGTVAIAKATELAVHRIERLVILKKIDAIFQTGLIGLRAEPSSENGATYKVVGYVASGADGKSLSITLWQDNQGKTLAYNVTPGPLPTNVFTWPEKDSSTLLEEGLHFVLEGWAQHPEVRAFYTGLQSIALTPAKDAAGNLMAQFKVTSTDDGRTLTINLKPDGTYLSYDLR
jgi:hypothetical protein